MVCSNCGREIPTDYNVCPYCNPPVMQNTVTPIPEKKNKNIILYGIIGILSVILLAFIVMIVLQIASSSDGSNIVLNNKSRTRTIMMYIDGADLESRAGIVTSDIESINKDKVDLENVNIYLYTGGSYKWYNDYISNQENAIFKLTSNGFEKVKTYPRDNMGDSKTLATFINYVYENSKTDEYDLSLYDHGAAIYGAIEDSFSGDIMELSEFKSALMQTPFNKNNKLGFVLFRTCLNGTLEVANIFKDYSNYLIASEEVTVGSSRTSVLNFVNDITKNDSPVDIGKKFITSYENQTREINNLSYSDDKLGEYAIIDLNKLDELNNSFEKFISKVDVKNNYSNIVKIRSDMYQYAEATANTGDYDTVDLYELVSRLSSEFNIDKTNFDKAYKESVVYKWGDLEQTNGLSIYFPYKGSNKVKSMFLNIYDKFDDCSNYRSFIKDFYTIQVSGGKTSFSSGIKSNEVTVSDKKENKEFTLELTKEQKEDYASSIYMVFRKDSEAGDNMYRIVYSSDNTKLGDDGVLKTNIGNNLIAIKNPENQELQFISLIERSKANVNTKFTIGILQDIETYKANLASGENNKWMLGTAYYFEEKDGKPFISKVKTQDDQGAYNVLVDINKYDTASFLASAYEIKTVDGHYSGNLDNKGIIRGYEEKTDKLDFVNASLQDGEEYVCVFKVQDIYGNVFYSDIIKLR